MTDINLNDLLQNIEVNTLNAEDSEAIEGPITYEESTQVLKAMSNNRSPGYDGFSSEFFKMFWKKLGHFIVHSINEGFAKVIYQLLKGKELLHVFRKISDLIIK